MEIVFATGNAHKVYEIQALCPSYIQLKSLKEIGFTEEIPETSPTIAGNSLQKANYIFERIQQAVIAEDTGLEVEYLQGLPGVNTARYAGENATAEDNIQKLLQALGSQKNRTARFVTVITFIERSGVVHQFEGTCEGEILLQKSGSKGFGYDPVFQPKGSSHSFAQMNLSQKNKYSHRAKAFRQFQAFLTKL